LPSTKTTRRSRSKKGPEVTPPTLSEVEKGHPVKVAGVRGTWKFMFRNSEKGEVTLYGGDPNPNAHRSYRTFAEDKIIVLAIPAETV
jgi:hypothetical protein